MMHFELSQLLLIEFSWTTSSSSALIIQINWKIKIKLKKKNQNTNSCTQNKIPLLNLRMRSMREFFFVDSKWRKECWPSYLQFAIAWQTSKRFSWKQLVSMTFSFMLAPWNAKHAMLSFSVLVWIPFSICKCECHHISLELRW